ncbi:hypothetical protein D558_3098 [Bordetella holmesii 44057]|nr:hypothetical protein D558_3098 [Bordetella holmesii 44057]
MLRFQGGVPLMSLPSMSNWPWLCWLKPAISRSSVDLPEPEGPSRAKNYPGSMLMLMLMSLRTSFLP